MKKISLLLMLFLLVGTFASVSAQEISVPEAKKVGVFENSVDNIMLAFTFNKESKINRVLKMAEKRLAEAETLIDEDPEAYAEAQARYDELVAQAEEILTEIESDSEDTNESLDNIAKLVRIQNRFEEHREQADEIYGRALARFELNNASDEKIARFENFYERSLNRSDEMETKLLERKENAIKKHKALGEVSDEELEELVDEVEESEGLKQAQEARAERAEVRTEKVAEIKVRNLERARLELNASNLTEAQRLEIQNRIEQATRVAEKFESKAESFASDDETSSEEESSETESNGKGKN